jgi:predicted DNA-binding mobile mystery protein A
MTHIMKNEERAAYLRRDLDLILRKWRNLPVPASRHGWIHDVREALGMMSSELAARMKVSGASITKMEQSEKKGTIRIGSLRRAARAMNCSLVYALVPNHGSLERVVEERLKKISFNTLLSLIPLKDIIKRDNMELVAGCAKYVKYEHLWTDDPRGVALIDSYFDKARAQLNAEMNAEVERAKRKEAALRDEAAEDEDWDDEETDEEEDEDEEAGDSEEEGKVEEAEEPIEVEMEEKKIDSESPAAQTGGVGGPRIRGL